jgi:hypothetical protein
MLGTQLRYEAVPSALARDRAEAGRETNASPMSIEKGTDAVNRACNGCVTRLNAAAEALRRHTEPRVASIRTRVPYPGPVVSS